MLWGLLAILLGRVLSVFMCSPMNNIYRKREPITCKFQIVMSLGGIRGSIAYILALKCSQDLKGENGRIIVFITIWVAMVTVFLLCYFS
jgi:NhaP-type Na+/H+ or K+/H+ antiporter